MQSSLIVTLHERWNKEYKGKDLVTMRSWVQMLKTASCINTEKGCIYKTQSGRTIPRTMRKREPMCTRLSFICSKWLKLHINVNLNSQQQSFFNNYSPGKRRHVQQLSVAEMHMVRWICGHTRRDQVRNDDICERLGVAPVEEKLVQHRLRWFGHIQRRPAEAQICNVIIRRTGNEKRGRG
jgi:hypothetical protein